MINYRDNKESFIESDEKIELLIIRSIHDHEYKQGKKEKTKKRKKKQYYFVIQLNYF